MSDEKPYEVRCSGGCGATLADVDAYGLARRVGWLVVSHRDRSADAWCPRCPAAPPLKGDAPRASRPVATVYHATSHVLVNSRGVVSTLNRPVRGDGMPASDYVRDLRAFADDIEAAAGLRKAGPT